MKKNLKILFYSFMFVFIISILLLIIIYFDIDLIVPLIITIVSIIILLYCFVLDFFIGHKYLEYYNEELSVKRKNKNIVTIPKSEMKKIVVLYDFFHEHIDFIRFNYNNKRYFFQIVKEDEKMIKELLIGLTYKKKSDFILKCIYFIIQLF